MDKEFGKETAQEKEEWVMARIAAFSFIAGVVVATLIIV